MSDNLSIFGEHHLYIFEANGKFWLVLDVSEIDEGKEISKALYDLMVKELVQS